MAKRKTAGVDAQASEESLRAARCAKAEEEMARATVALLMREPFFGHLLGGMPRHWSWQIPTMAVGLRGDTVQLLVNPDFVLTELTRTETRAAVVKHEVLHVVFKHLFRAEPKANRLLWNIAADLVVNQYVAPWTLPAGAVTLATFPDMGLPRESTVEDYYERLLELYQAMQAADGEGDSDGEGDADAPGGGDGDGNGDGTEAAGTRRGSSPSKGSQRGASPRSAEALRRLIQAGGASDHSCWASGQEGELDGESVGRAVPGPVRDALDRAAEDALMRAAERVALRRGTMPAWAQRLLVEIAERRKPKVDWRHALRVFAQSSRRTRVVATTRRESKRFESVPGVRRYAGLKIKRFQRLAVIIDTSGSVNDEMLRAFFAEIRGMHKQGAEVVIAECDAAVQRSYDFKGKQPLTVSGGGGTAFEPAMQWLKAQRSQRFDACIYLTDGCASAPTTRPPCRLMWLVVGDGEMDHLPFGRRIRVLDV